MFGDTDRVRDKSLKHEVTRKIAEHGLASQCVLMGPRFPIEPWIMGCDMLVAPAVNETFGRTLVEAMLCGTPVVAADDGGHKEIIRHGETGTVGAGGRPGGVRRRCRRADREAPDGEGHRAERQGPCPGDLFGRDPRRSGPVDL